MGFLQITSDNKNISHVISKNPASGMTAKTLRKGYMLGYFSSNTNQEYNVFFKDGDDEISFPDFVDQEYEYLSKSKFNNVYMYLSILKDLFDIKVDNKHDKIGKHEITLAIVEIPNSKYLNIFDKYFDGFTIESFERAVNNYEIKFKTQTRTFRDLFLFSQVFLIFNTLAFYKALFVENALFQKYGKMIADIDAPYFIKYLFKSYCINNKKAFNDIKLIFESTTRYESLEFKYGDTGLMRKEWVQDNLDLNSNILDIGCGEGYYFNISTKIPGKKYYAVDINEKAREKATNKKNRKSLNNVEIYENHIQAFEIVNQEPVEIILIEVIEHMSSDNAVNLINDIKSKFNWSKFIITTPDSNFNKHYVMNTEMRHDDHNFEFTRGEFEQFIIDIFGNGNFDIEFQSIGDIVDCDSPSQGAIISKKK